MAKASGQRSHQSCRQLSNTAETPKTVSADDLDKNNDFGDETGGKGKRANERNAGVEDQRMSKPGPEKDLCAHRRHIVAFGGKMGDDDQDREMREVLGHIEMDALCPLPPACERFFLTRPEILRGYHTVLSDDPHNIGNPEHRCETSRKGEI